MNSRLNASNMKCDQAIANELEVAGEVDFLDGVGRQRNNRGDSVMRVNCHRLSFLDRDLSR